MTEEIALPAPLVADLLALAAASPREEICGLLFGYDGRIEAIAPAANILADRSRAFELDPAMLLAAHRAARTGGPRLAGHYHSHPSGEAVPSPRDRAAAMPGQLWMILGGGTARLWRATDRGFEEVGVLLTER